MAEAPRDRLARVGPWVGGLVNAQPPGMLSGQELWRADDVDITERGAVRRREPLRTLWADAGPGALLAARTAQVGLDAVVIAGSVSSAVTTFRTVDIPAFGEISDAGNSIDTHDATQASRIGEATDVWVPSFAQVGNIIYACYRGGLVKQVVYPSHGVASWQRLFLIGSVYDGVGASYNNDYRTPTGILQNSPDAPLLVPGDFDVPSAIGIKIGLAMRVVGTSVEAFILEASGSVTVVDPADGTEKRSFTIDADATRITWDEHMDRLWAQTGSKTFQLYTAQGGVAGNRTVVSNDVITSSSHQQGFAVSATNLFMYGEVDGIGRMFKISKADMSVESRITFPFHTHSPLGYLDGTEELISTYVSDLLRRFSITPNFSFSPLTQFDVPGGQTPVDIEVLRDRIYFILNADDDKVYSTDRQSQPLHTEESVGNRGAFPACDIIATYQRGDSQAMLAARGDTLRWSHPYPIDERTGAEDWADDDHLLVNPDDNDWITAMIQFQDHLLVFKRRSTWGLFGASPSSWRQVSASRSLGTLSPNSATQTPFGVAFYDSASRSLWLWDGASMTDMFKGRVRLDIDLSLNTADSDRRTAVGYNNHHLYLSVPERSGQATYDTDMQTGITVRRTHGFAAFANIEGNTRDMFVAIPANRPDTDTTLLSVIEDRSATVLTTRDDGADDYRPDEAQYQGRIATATILPDPPDVPVRWRNPIMQLMRDTDTPLADPWGPAWSVSFGGAIEAVPSISGEVRIDHEAATDVELAPPGLGSLILHQEGDNMGTGLSARFLAVLPPGDDGHTFLTSCIFRYWPQDRNR